MSGPVRQTRRVALARQGGFTLIEVVVASTVGLILMLVAFSFFLETARMAEMMGSRIRLNSEARLMDTMIREGARVSGTAFVPGLQNSAMLAGGVSSPYNVLISRLGQRLTMTDQNDPDVQATSPEESVVIQCTGFATPHPDCAVPGAAVIDGYLAADPVLSSDNRSLTIDRHCGVGQRSVIAELELTLMDGHLMGSRDTYVQDQLQRRFFQAMALQVDCP